MNGRAQGQPPVDEPGHDVGIVGAGPAGLSAALILGRCRRDVVVFDSGRPRNAPSQGLHGFLTRDGIHPAQLRELGRRDLLRYRSVQVRDIAVTAAERRGSGFRLQAADGSTTQVRILLLATGRDDALPDRPGFAELYGRGVYHCPFCDGWEHRDQALVVYGRGEPAGELALELLTWSRAITLCSDGPSELDAGLQRRLRANGIAVREGGVSGLRAGADARLAAVRFQEGPEEPCGALFFVAECPQKSALPERLGCRFAPSGGVHCDVHAATDVPGLFVAGNVRCGLHLAVSAAAEGAEAAVAMNEYLLEQELRDTGEEGPEVAAAGRENKK